MSRFTYYAAADGAKNGLLASEVIEGPANNPANPGLCVSTVYTYDDYGNKASATTANCTGATGLAVFASRTSTVTYPTTATSQIITVGTGSPTVGVAPGLFPTSAANALAQTETREHDPRFGAVLKVTLDKAGVNELVTGVWRVDDFGRKTRETRPDGTGSVSAYCVLAGTGLSTSANSSTANGDPMDCPTPGAGEAPADAVAFVHSEPRDASTSPSPYGAKMGPFSRVYTDRLGREIRSVTESFDGAAQPAAKRGVAIVRDSLYNAYGAKVLQTQPYFLASGSSTTTGSNDQGVSLTEYDALGRVKAVSVVDAAGGYLSADFGPYGGVRRAARQSIGYSALTVTTTNDQGQIRTEEKNALGLTISVTDASGAQIAYQHDAFGNLTITRDALQNITTLSYDIRGRKVAMTDPDSGLWTYDYDALGQLVRQQNPTQRATATYTTLAYDKLGRTTQRVEPEYTSSWTYDQYATPGDCVKGIGKLCLSATTGGASGNVARKYVYDLYGRPVNTRTDLAGGPSVASAVAYDATTGRIASRTWPSGLQVKYVYTTGAAKGYLDKLTLGTALTVNPLPATPGGTPGASASFALNALLWQARIVNAWGGLEQQLHGAATGGSQITGKTAYDAATGRITDRSAGAGAATDVLSQHTAWDSLNNLASRSDDNGDGATGPVAESYTYDAINRLTGYTVQAQSIAGASRSVTLRYNALGMLLYKSDTGNYAYPAQAGVRPHALQSLASASTTSYTYDANGNLTTASAGKYRSLTYTSFNLPDASLGVAGASNSPRYT